MNYLDDRRVARGILAGEQEYRDFSRFDRQKFISVDEEEQFNEEVTIVACKDPRFYTAEMQRRPKNFVRRRWRTKCTGWTRARKRKREKESSSRSYHKFHRATYFAPLLGRIF